MTMSRKTKRKSKVLKRAKTRKGKKHDAKHLRASVKLANSKSNLLKDLGSSLKHYKSEHTGNCFDMSCFAFVDCPQNLFSWMMKLLEQNMAELYAACDWGWSLEDKRKEMSEEAARFIIAFSENKPVAFTHFRFDLDDGASVVYCYELQVDKDAQKQGLAKHIMKMLDSICHNHNMNKVVLTVFNHNENAYKFFTSQGYELDESSPQNYKLDTFYSILSKVNSEYKV